MRTFLTRLEQASRLDRITDRVQRVIRPLLRPEALRDALHGVWLGHPLHPTLVQMPLGAWLSASTLDLLPGQRRAATALVAVGTASALPAAVTGVNDWSSLSREQQRVGLVHAAANLTAVSLYAGSLAARLRGRHALGRSLGFLGLAAAAAGGYLGGHLAYRQVAGVNQSASELRRVPEGWQPVGDLASLPEGELVTRRLGEVPVVVYREGDAVTVLLERCAHHTGPLGKGSLTRVDGSTCVVCPWHGSTFRLIDGTVVHGPAATDQQTLPVQIVGGTVEARLP
jgi:nitrite reductase/ring-hydroxylating ferredoxin subunit/uncharacterized membrane protein